MPAQDFPRPARLRKGTSARGAARADAAAAARRATAEAEPPTLRPQQRAVAGRPQASGAPRGQR